VDLFNTLMRGSIGGYGRLFGDLPPLVSLTVLSVVIGIAMLWVVARTSDQKGIERTKKRLQAYLLEMRLYGDDLSLVWRSQRNLFVGNLRYMGLMLKPALYMTVPVVLLMIHMDAFYGWSPLPVGQAAVVTVQAAAPLDAGTPAPTIEAPPGIVVETPAVRALGAGQFSWRIRPQQPTAGVLQFDWNGSHFEKTITAGTGSHYLSTRRVRSAWESLWYPGENRLEAANVEWVEASYPPATVDFAGLDWHWIIWFLLISIVSAYLLKGYFNVVI
jgi:uncharacterized membrane protein (DUF106 family)